MCELLGMNANVPTDICFSFAGLMRRGGQTGPHADGWGMVFYDGKGCRAFHDPHASAESELAHFVTGYSIKSTNVICHIRRANRGRVALENTHPFIRELWGQYWTYAHNGQLKGIKRWPLDYYKPVGTTDSEHAFCWMLDQLRARWPKPPAYPALCRMIRDMSARLNGLGVFNLLLSDGRSLFAHCSTNLAWLTRRHPFGNATLIDADLTVDFAQETTANDIVTVIATRPLTRNETWTVMEPGTMTVFREGLVVVR